MKKCFTGISLALSLIFAANMHGKDEIKSIPQKSKQPVQQKKEALAKPKSVVEKKAIKSTSQQTRVSIKNNSQKVADKQITPPVKKKKPPVKKKPSRWIVNKILARVNGANILQSDLEQPRIAKEGGSYSLKELIEEEILFQRASEKHLLPSNVDIQRQIVALKMQNGISHLSDSEFEKELQESGFTLPMYKKQLARLIAVENLKRVEIDEKIVITSKEVEKYHKKNPEYDEASFLLETASFSPKNVDNYKDLIRNKKITWNALGWLSADELDKRFESVKSLEKGQISKPIKLSEKNYLVFRLKDKQEKSFKKLETRYGEIERILKDQKREFLSENLIKETQTKTSIIYL